MLNVCDSVSLATIFKVIFVAITTLLLFNVQKNTLTSFHAANQLAFPRSPGKCHFSSNKVVVNMFKDKKKKIALQIFFKRCKDSFQCSVHRPKQRDDN